MQQESAALAAKGAATGASAVMAYLGIPLAGLVILFAAALFGAIASLHWRPPAAGSTVVKVLLQVFALSVAAAIAAALIPYLTDSKIGEAPGGLLAGALGLFVGVLYDPVANRLANWIGRPKEGG